MSQGMPARSAGAMKYILVIFTLLVVLAGGIELSRRLQEKAPPKQDANLNAASPFPREIQDSSGEKLIISALPQRIVSQTLGSDEILMAICPHERILALSIFAEDENYSNIVEEARKLPRRPVQGAEAILQLHPDLIFVASYNLAESVQMLKASRAPVFRFANFNSIEDIKTNIRIVGHAVGRDAEAELLSKQIDDSLAAVRKRIPTTEKKPRLMSYGPGGYTAGSNTTFHDMVSAVGAMNASAEKGIDGIAKISTEKFVEWDPDYIVAGSNSREIESYRKSLLADPIIAASRAGKLGHVIVMNNRHFLTVSHNIGRAVEELADKLYAPQK